MPDKKSANIELLEKAIKEIDPILDKVAFVGGITTILHITEKIEDIRATTDVDAIIDANLKEPRKSKQHSGS